MRSSRPEPATFTGLLTDEQFRAAVKVLEQRGGTDLLSAPKVTTLSGRQAQIQVVNIKYIVTDLEIKKEAPIKGAPTQETAAQVERRKVFKAEIRSGDPTVLLLVSDDESTVPPIAEPFELGLVIDVIPYVNADGRTIQMTVLPMLREFLGYDPDPLRRKEDIQATGGPFANNQITTPRPKFRLRQVSTTTTVLDGQTLVIGAGTARTVERKRGASGVSVTNYVEKELFFFITPRVLDPASNLLRAE